MAEYDYGEGQTYATPQAAFDACQAANESGDAPETFTETNYIRGHGDAGFGNAAGGEPVLRLVHSVSGRGVLPTQEHRLVIDANALDRVEFVDAEGVGCIVGGASDGTDLASHVTIDLPRIHSTAASEGKAIIVCPDRTGGETARDWVIKCPALHASHSSLILGSLNSARLEVQLQGPNRQLGENGDPEFDGVGLDDLAVSGTPGSGIPREYVVEIDEANDPDPDTFKWSADGGATWVGEEIEITGETQLLQEGIYVQFSALTGHTLADAWTWATAYSGGAIWADGSARTYGSFSGTLTLVNCAAAAEGPVINLTGNFTMGLIHSSLYSAISDAIRLSADERIDLLLLNNIIETAGDGVSCISTDLAELRVLHAEGNCYYFPGEESSLLDLDGNSKTFAQWKSLYGQDGTALNADPLFTDPVNADFTLGPQSPCRLRGRAAAPSGLEGNERAISIDIGAYQPSLPANWSLGYQDGNMVVKVEGRVKVDGF